MNLKKIHYILYYKVYKSFESLSVDNWSDWKALVFVSAFDVLLLMELFVWWVVFTKQNIEFSKYWLIIPSLLIVVLNYYYFLDKMRWKKYEIEFRSYSKSKSTMYSFIMLFIVLLMLSSLIFSFYYLGLVSKHIASFN